MPAFELEASLRIWAVDAVIAGVAVRVPPLPAADWLPVLASGDVTGVLRLAGVNLRRQLIAGELTTSELIGALNAVIEQAAGRSSWAAMMLAGSAAAHWHVVGADLARVGVRFDVIPIGAALDAIYGSLCRAMDEKGIARLNASLDRPQGAQAEKGQQVPAHLIKQAELLPATAEQYVRVRPKTRLRRPEPLPDGQTAQPTPRRRPRAGSGRPAATGSRPAAGGSRPAG